MNNTQELYHYGTPGMKWGRRKGKQANKTLSKAKTKSKTDSKTETKPKVKPKTSKGIRIAIGATAAGVALAGIGAMLSSKTIRDRRITSIVAKTFRENM